MCCFDVHFAYRIHILLAVGTILLHIGFSKTSISKRNILPLPRKCLSKFAMVIDSCTDLTPTLFSWHKKLLEIPSVKKAWAERAALSA